MPTARRIEIFGFLLVLCFIGLFARGWRDERVARNRAEVVASAQQKLIAQKQTEIDARDAAAATFSRQTLARRANLSTLPQAVKAIEQTLPETDPGFASEPILTVHRGDLSDAIRASLPPAPDYAILTPIQTVAIAKDELACSVAQNDLQACKSDRFDLAAQVRSAQVESDAWKSAAKGGSKWHRFGRAIKLVGCAAGGAAGGALLSRSSPTTGAAIGSAAAATACQMF